MKSNRVLRVQDTVRREISRIVQNELRDPRIGMLTVTEVDLSPDLKNGRILVSVMGSEKEKTDSLIGIRKAGAYIRRRLAGAVQLKNVPRLHFEYDHGPERGERMILLTSDFSAESHDSRDH